MRTCRWCDRSIKDARHSAARNGRQCRVIVWNARRERQLGGVHPGAQTAHMDASDPHHALTALLQAGGRPHMRNCAMSWTDWPISTRRRKPGSGCTPGIQCSAMLAQSISSTAAAPRRFWPSIRGARFRGLHLGALTGAPGPRLATAGRSRRVSAGSRSAQRSGASSGSAAIPFWAARR